MIKKLKKPKKWKRSAENVLIFTALLLLVYFTMEFVYSWHNIDLVQNFCRVTSSINDAGFHNDENQTIYVPFDSVKDVGSDYVERPLTDYYIPSSNSIRYYFLLSIFDALFIGVMLGRRL